MIKTQQKIKNNSDVKKKLSYRPALPGTVGKGSADVKKYDALLMGDGSCYCHI